MILFGASQKLESLKRRVGDLDTKLTYSFDNVRGDVNNIFEWIDYLDHKVTHQGQQITHMHRLLKDIPKNSEEIRRIVDDYYLMQPVSRRLNRILPQLEALEQSGRDISSLKAKISRIIDENPVLQENLESLMRRVENLEKRERRQPSKADVQAKPAPKTRLQQKVIRTVARSSKEYVKNQILSLIQKYGEVSALKLRDIIVEDQGIASKSSFYRMLEELEKEGSIEMMRVGKEKHYFALEKVKQR